MWWVNNKTLTYGVRLISRIFEDSLFLRLPVRLALYFIKTPRQNTKFWYNLVRNIWSVAYFHSSAWNHPFIYLSFVSSHLSVFLLCLPSFVFPFFSPSCMVLCISYKFVILLLFYRLSFVACLLSSIFCRLLSLCYPLCVSISRLFVICLCRLSWLFSIVCRSFSICRLSVFRSDIMCLLKCVSSIIYVLSSVFSLLFFVICWRFLVIPISIYLIFYLSVRLISVVYLFFCLILPLFSFLLYIFCLLSFITSFVYFVLYFWSYSLGRSSIGCLSFLLS